MAPGGRSAEVNGDISEQDDCGLNIQIKRKMFSLASLTSLRIPQFSMDCVGKHIYSLRTIIY